MEFKSRGRHHFSRAGAPKANPFMSNRRVNIIFLCGRNEALAASLEQNDWQETRVLIQGFTTRVPYFMQLVDFCVCKPGPGVCSEAALVGLPMIVEWGMFTLPQEVAVGRWILERGAGAGLLEQQPDHRVCRAHVQDDGG